MYHKSPHRLTRMFFVGVSISGMIISLTLASQTPTATEFNNQKPLIGATFTIFCVLGVVAAVTPRKCSESLGSKARSNKFGFYHVPTCIEKPLAGHHPNCEKFSAHVINLRGRYICAACTGLFLGGLIDLVGTFLYFFFGWEYKIETFVIVFIGILAVLIGFFQLKFSRFARSLLNVSFVVGCYLVLSGMDQSQRSLSYDLFIFSLIVFWLVTRILLSQWDHERICMGCDLMPTPKKKWG